MTIPPSEKVYVLEINGAPILAFAAVSHREAQSLLREEWLRADLRGIRSGGKPIWDGAANLVELDVEGPTGRIQALSLRLYDTATRQWTLQSASVPPRN